MKIFLNKHKWGIIAAFFVGLICVLPQIFFISNLGEKYRGIHIYATPNEEAYIAIMQEILDGHPRVASMPFYEYKDGSPLLPSTLFRFYTWPAQLLNVSLVSMVIAGKFVFPFLLFFIVYLFLFDLLKPAEREGNKWRIIFSLAAASLVVLGFDLVDYTSIISYLKGQSSPEGFLIWTRPINPVSGAIFLFFFLFCLNRISLKKKNIWLLWPSLALALMMASYVFSWTLAVVILGLYCISALVQKKWCRAGEYVSILFLGIIFSLPYWINAIRVAKMPWFKEASARIGMLYTHAPHFNKVIFATIILFLSASAFGYYKRVLARPLSSWWWLSSALLLSSLIVYNQQIITGREIWYYHYVFYTIPLAYVVIVMLLWYVVRKVYPKFTIFVVSALFVSSLSFGLFFQISAYAKNVPIYALKQNNRDIFDFFNTQAEKDCVVLIKEENIGEWSNPLLAFTHCNTYYSGENQSVLANPDDFYYRYMALLRLRGVKGEDIEQYMVDKKSEVEHMLQYQLQRTLGYPDKKLEQRLNAMPAYYREFVQDDFATQLSRFQIDYIMSEGKIGDEVLAQLPNISEITTIHDLVIYKF